MIARRTTRHRAAAALLVLGGSLDASIARADATTDVKAAAQTLFEEARAGVEHGRFDEACPKFAESQRLDPGIGTQLWLADCYENSGQTASAWATFKEAAAASALKRDQREQVARERAAALEAKLSRLIISVPANAGAQGLEVRRDGVLLGPVQWSVAVPGDPGVHTITARAAGRREWSTTVTLPHGPGTLQVNVPELEPLPPPARAPTTGDTQRWIGLGVVGTGLVGVALGTYFSLSAKSAYDASNEGGHCVGNACDPTGKEDRTTAFRQAGISTIAFAVGGAAVACGAVLYLTARRDVSVSTALATQGGGIVRIATAW